MLSIPLRTLVNASVICATALLLTACKTTGSGTKDVTISSIKYVCLSRKDTQGTKRQVAENNGVLKELGAPAPNCKKVRT